MNTILWNFTVLLLLAAFEVARAASFGPLQSAMRQLSAYWLRPASNSWPIPMLVFVTLRDPGLVHDRGTPPFHVTPHCGLDALVDALV